MGFFEVGCVLFVICTVVVSILAFIYNSDSEAVNMTLQDDDEYDKKRITARKK